MDGVTFLTLDEVLRIHLDQIARHGGSDVVLDLRLIESAIMQPQMGFGGEYFHDDIASMAAAYLFHLSKNHGFEDGNKRTAAAAAIVFLKLNGIQLKPPVEGELERLTLDVVSRATAKEDAARFFRERIIT